MGRRDGLTHASEISALVPGPSLGLANGPSMGKANEKRMTNPTSPLSHHPETESPTAADARPSAEEVARIAAQMGDERKAEDVRVLNIADATVIADYFVMMTGFNRRQIQNIAWEIDREMKMRGVKKLGFEGYETAWWVLLDYGDVVVHIFHADARNYYDLDMLWADATEYDWRGKELVPIATENTDDVDATYEPLERPAAGGDEDAETDTDAETDDSADDTEPADAD